MCDQDQTEAFVSPGYDENLHACSVCLDSGLSMKDQSYCEACSMGDKISNFDAYVYNSGLSRRKFNDALRIVFRATMKTEKARAAAEQAMLIAGHQRAIKTMIDGFEIERSALLARIVTLQANVTAAETDTARLDFAIEKETTWYPGRGKDGAGILCFNRDGDRAEEYGTTMRDAIDAALAANNLNQEGK